MEYTNFLLSLIVEPVWCKNEQLSSPLRYQRKYKYLLIWSRAYFLGNFHKFWWKKLQVLSLTSQYLLMGKTSVENSMAVKKYSLQAVSLHDGRLIKQRLAETIKGNQIKRKIWYG